MKRQVTHSTKPVLDDGDNTTCCSGQFGPVKTRVRGSAGDEGLPVDPRNDIVRQVRSKCLTYTYHNMVDMPLLTCRSFGTYKIIDKQSSVIAESATLGWGHKSGMAEGSLPPFLRKAN